MIPVLERGNWRYSSGQLEDCFKPAGYHQKCAIRKAFARFVEHWYHLPLPFESNKIPAVQHVISSCKSSKMSFVTQLSELNENFPSVTMPLMRIAVCFEGRIITHDHIFSDPLRPRPPRVLAIPHLPYSYLSLLCHSCFYSRFLLPSFFPLFISSLHVQSHLASFRTHTAALGSQPKPHTISHFYCTPTPVPLRLFYQPLHQFYSSILTITTFTTRYSPFSFTYKHIITHFPTLLLPYPTYNTSSTGIQIPFTITKIINYQKLEIINNYKLL